MGDRKAAPAQTLVSSGVAITQPWRDASDAIARRNAQARQFIGA